MEHSATPTLVRENASPRLGAVDGWWKAAGGSKRPDMVPSRKKSVFRRLLSEGGAVFILSFSLYFFVAWLLDLKYRTFIPDAVSRMANGFYILYSRDPHLAAVGFVWEPLQSVGDAVFLIGNNLWPALSHNNMAGSLVSALAMAGAAYQICTALREWGVSRVPRLVLTAFFAVNPLIILYAASGMSEGLYVFTLIASTRYLLRWVHKGELRSLGYSAVALGFSYLTRNEAVGGAVAGAVAVGIVSFWRADGPRISKIKTAIEDFTIFAAPPFIAAVGWAVCTYVITGEVFAQLQSMYGNSTQEQFTTHLTFHNRVIFELHSIGAWAPALPIVLVVAAVLALRRKDPRILAPLGVLGGALGFDVLAYLDNAVQDQIRYFICAFPLGILLLGSIVAAIQNPGPAAPGATERSQLPGLGSRVLGVLAAICLLLVVMIPTTITSASAMFNPKIGILESQEIDFIFHKHLSYSDIEQKDNYGWILAIGDWFTNRHLPDSDVVADNYPECVPPLLTTVNQPKLFVIPNDRDFERILADPITFHTHYILEADPASFPNTTINDQWPTLWKTGAGFTKLADTFPSRADCPEFRLFHVLGHSSET